MPVSNNHSPPKCLDTGKQRSYLDYGTNRESHKPNYVERFQTLVAAARKRDLVEFYMTSGRTYRIRAKQFLLPRTVCRFSIAFAFALAVGTVLFASSLAAHAQSGNDGMAYLVTSFNLRAGNGSTLDVNQLSSVEVELSKIGGGFASHQRADTSRNFTTSLSQLQTSGAHVFYTSGLEDLISQLSNALRTTNIPYATVSIDPTQIDPNTGEDLRTGTGDLNLIVTDRTPGFHITGFRPAYAEGHPDIVPVEEVLDAPIKLADIGDAYGPPQRGAAYTSGTLRTIAAEGGSVFQPGAIKAINTQLVKYFNERGVVGIFVVPDSQDLANARTTPTEIDLTVHVALVGEIRTLGAGLRKHGDERENNKAHDRIRRLSPLVSSGEAGNGGDGGKPGDIIRRDLLDDYIYRLNRHPGRRVDLAVSADEEPGYVVLDYLVSEAKPWYLLYQITNTGTESTETYRHRISFTHNQLTNNDDIFRFDYVTAGFEEVHAFSTSYEAPVGDSQKWRWKVYGSYNEYESSEVGISNALFEGEGFSVGGRLIANVYQRENLFVDLYGGVRYEETEVNNVTFAPFATTEGKGEFVIPEIGVTLNRIGDYYATTGSLGFEFQVNDNDQDDLVALGRASPDDKWVKLLWNLNHSFYLEPVLNKKAWRDPSTPQSSTLAHELWFSFRGQHAIDDRLPPSHEATLGGFYTVRGYEESAIASDTALIGSVEYRLHVPRLLAIAPPRDFFGQPFRVAPDRVYGQPDWDLILRTFFDVGRALYNNEIGGLENDATLMSAGIGAEVQVRNNLSLRADWGWVLHDVDFTSGDSADKGDNRVHVSATFLW